MLLHLKSEEQSQGAGTDHTKLRFAQLLVLHLNHRMIFHFLGSYIMNKYGVTFQKFY
jgi:hypothetical protein